MDQILWSFCSGTVYYNRESSHVYYLLPKELLYNFLTEAFQ